MGRTKAIPLLVVLVVTGGCVQAIAGGPITFEASEAGVSEDALEEHRYELKNRSSFTADRTVDLPAVGERRVVVTNHIAVYSRLTVDDANASENSASAFFLLSTPRAEVAGQSTNPLGRVPLKELARRVGSRAGDQSEVEHVDSRSLTVLGTETTVEKFRSTTSAEGRSVSTFVYVTRVSHGDDYVVAVGILPQRFANHESDVYGLMEAIEHEGS